MKLFYIILTSVLLLGAAGWWLLDNCTGNWCLIFDWQKVKRIDSFEKCQAAGYPIMKNLKSKLRQCRAGEKTFTETVPAGNDKIKLSSPLPNAVVSSPLWVTGEARGTWYFEASFPVKLFDANGQQIAVVPAQAQGDWMTQEFVPFEAVLDFAAPQTDSGVLILEKDNPSGLPEQADSVSIPVRFK